MKLGSQELPCEQTMIKMENSELRFRL